MHEIYYFLRAVDENAVPIGIFSEATLFPLAIREFDCLRKNPGISLLESILCALPE